MDDRTPQGRTSPTLFPKWWQTLLAWWNALPTWATTMILVFGGAAYNYVDTIPQAQLLGELTTSAGIWALVKGAVFAGLGGLALLVKQSFVKNPLTLTEIKLRHAAAKMQQRGLVRVEALAIVVWMLGAGASAAVGIAILGGSALQACTPAQVAAGFDVSAVVLKGLLAGESLPQIEADMTRELVRLDASVLDIDIALVVEDALQLLLDSHAIPPNLIPTAQRLKAESRATQKVTP